MSEHDPGKAMMEAIEQLINPPLLTKPSFIYFTPGYPWVRKSDTIDHAVCPIYCYGVNQYSMFVFDTQYQICYSDRDPINQAKRRAHSIAQKAALALTIAAQIPAFNIEYFIRQIEGQL